MSAKNALERDARFQNDIREWGHFTRPNEGVRLGQVLLQLAVRHVFNLNVWHQRLDVGQLFWVLRLNLFGQVNLLDFEFSQDVLQDILETW